MNNKIEGMVSGFYAAFLTGIAGNSMAMFVFDHGVISGADIGGGKYDGKYEITPDGKFIIGKITFVLPSGNWSITGASSETKPLQAEIPIKLPSKISPDIVYRIETPLGPVNAKFEKIRDK